MSLTMSTLTPISRIPVQHSALYESFRKYRWLLFLTVLFSLLAAVFEIFSIGLLIPFLRSLSRNTDQAFGTGIYLIDHWVLAIEASKVERLYRVCGFILLCTWIRSLLSYTSSIYGMKTRAWTVEDLRMRIVDQLQRVSLRFFSKAKRGELINSLTNEINGVSSSLMVITTVVSRGSLLLAYILVMVLISWQLSVLVVASFGLLSLALTRLISRIRRSGKKIPQANGRFVSSATEFISGIRTVIAFNNQAYERERMQNAANGVASAIIETGRRSFMVQPVSQAVVGTVLIVVIVLATQFFVLPGKLDIALLLTFLFALFRLMPIMHALNNQRGELAKLKGSLSNVEELLQLDNKPYLVDGNQEAPPLLEAIVFDGVSFAYEPSEPILHDINLRIERGKTTAIVGASGAGKSTLVDLIPRFHDPDGGRVLLDDVDLRDLKVASLRQQIAVVSQTSFIFNDTVDANIAYGMADVTTDRIREAAEQANALEFIEAMPEGFETELGDQGVRLSGGQRQRIAIARALLRDPEILILDEATSALDSVSERLVQQSLEGLMRGRTVIAIAHRLSTVENADWVVVLEEGRIVEQGTYDELLIRKGQLWEYHSLQFQSA